LIRALIVEDEPPSLRRIARMIEESGMGFEVVATAGDGEQALERLNEMAKSAETPCDVVFTDIRMPVMDGLQLMDAIRERFPACQIVVISGYQEYAYFSRALRAKAVDYLLKPLSKQDMDSLLRRLRDQHEERQQARRHILEAIDTALSLQDLSAGMENLGTPAAGAFGQPSVSQRSVAEEVERYLRAHFAEHISLQMLGTVFGYVPSYVSLLFRKAYSVSPADYLTRIRLDEAKRLMQQNPDMLIREISERVGFKSQHHFSRVFKKNEGVWPTRYVEESE